MSTERGWYRWDGTTLVRADRVHLPNGTTLSPAALGETPAPVGGWTWCETANDAAQLGLPLALCTAVGVMIDAQTTDARERAVRRRLALEALRRIAAGERLVTAASGDAARDEVR